MFLIKENGEKSTPYFQTIINNSTDDGLMMFFPELSVAKWFARDGMAERNVIYWCADTFIKSDKVFIDIGAHIGTYTMVCASKAKHTYAFECSPKTFCYLAANIALHKLEERVSLFNNALGETYGQIDYIIRSEDGGGNGIKVLNNKDASLRKLYIIVKPLDDFNIENIGFIKIDVEGAELEVLKGSIQTLVKSNYPPILFESWGEWKTDVPLNLRADLFAYFNSLGYSIKEIKGAKDTFLATHPLFV